MMYADFKRSMQKRALFEWIKAGGDSLGLALSVLVAGTVLVGGGLGYLSAATTAKDDMSEENIKSRYASERLKADIELAGAKLKRERYRMDNAADAPKAARVLG